MTRFEPRTELERLLVTAQDRPTDARAYRGFVEALIGVMLGVLGRVESHGFQPLVMSPAGVPGVCAFSHPERYDRFVNDLMLPARDWEVRPQPARQLFSWMVHNDLTLLLNPGSDYGKDFPALELARLLRGEWV